MTGQELKQLRQAAGLTYSEAARRFGYRVRTLRLLEKLDARAVAELLEASGTLSHYVEWLQNQEGGRMTNEPEKPDQWCVVEFMGHTRTAGRVTEEQHFGAAMGRLDIPKNDGTDGYTTVLFGGASVFRMTPCTEAVARIVAKGNQPHPVSPYEMPASQKALAYRDEDDDEDSL